MVGEVWPWLGGYGHSRGGDGHGRGGDEHDQGGDGHGRGGDGHGRTFLAVLYNMYYRSPVLLYKCTGHA